MHLNSRRVELRFRNSWMEHGAIRPVLWTAPGNVYKPVAVATVQDAGPST